MKYTFSFIFLAFFLFNFSIAQNPSALDSLWNAYRTQKNDSLKLNAANYLAFHYIFRTPSTADSILEKSLVYARKNKVLYNLTELTNTRGIYYDVLGQKDSSKVYFEKALQLSKQHNFLSLEERCTNNLGMFNWNNGRFKEALAYFYDALEFSLTHNPDNKAGRSIYLNNIGLIQQELGQYEEAINYHNQALEIRKEFNKLKDIAQSYNNLAICYKNLGQLEKAEQTIRQGINYAEKADQPKLYHQYHDNLGNILNELERYDEAEAAYLTALEVPEEFKNRNNRNEFILLSNLINLYYETDQIDKGIATIEKAKGLIDEDSTLFAVSETYHANGAKIFYKTGNKKRADEFFEQFLILKDSLFSQENASALADVEAKLKTKEKEAELADTKNQLLEQEIKVKQQNFMIYGGISAIVLLLVLSYFIIRSKQLKNKQLQKEAELQKALAKIELKNKLEEQRIRISKDLHDNIGSQLTFVISGLQFIEYQKDITVDSIKSKVQSIGEFTQQTIHELRDTIWAMNKEEIQLAELISRFSNFINRLSIAETISITTSKSAEEKSEEITFSALEGIQIYRIIQEAVNNAIKYAEASAIDINFDFTDALRIIIKDDGQGFEMGKVKKGNGIKNMKSRAKKLNAKLEIQTKKEEGTSIILTLPKLTL